MCHLSPREVDEMGWIDLIRFTLQVDDENARVERKMRDAEMAAKAPPPSALPPTRL